MAAGTAGDMPDGADVVVVGSGSAGLTAALRAASLGASVLVLERDHVGRHDGDLRWCDLGAFPLRDALVERRGHPRGRSRLHPRRGRRARRGAGRRVRRERLSHGALRRRAHADQLDPAALARLGSRFGLQLSPPGHEGEALGMAGAIGAAVAHLDEAWWMPAFAAADNAFEGAPVGRPLLGDRGLPGTIFVNRRGERFANESESSAAMTFGFLAGEDAATRR